MKIQLAATIPGRFTIASGALAAYEPGFDRDGRALEACKRILAGLAAVAEAPG
jgi:hypothetical protein